MKVGIVCIAKNEENYIYEWIDYHLKLGFDHVYVFKNDWNFNINHPNVTEFVYDGPGVQMAAYAKFANERHGCDWAAFIDVDEFIVLKKHKNIKQFINAYPQARSLAINWYIFGDNGHTQPDRGVLRRFTKRGAKVNQHIKVLVKLGGHIVFPDPHHSNIPWMDTSGKTGTSPFNPDGPTDVAQINHYYNKTLPEFLEKVERGRADGSWKVPRHMFDIKNQNEVEDTLALDFYDSFHIV